MDTDNKLQETHLFNQKDRKRFDNTDSIKLNRTYKDSTFCYIFSNPEEFVELYYYLTGVQYHSNDVEEERLDSVVIADWHNDISFLTKDKHILMFIEQQSSLCVNMSVRCLVYYSNLLHKLYQDNEDNFKSNIYSGTSIKIPRPEFYIFYIGSTKLKNQIEYLHDHFYDKKSSMIDLQVRNIDIHYDKLKDNANVPIVLLGYSYFVDRVNYYEESSNESNKGKRNLEAIQKAIIDCREKGYLLNYLDRKEFLTMAQNDFTINDFIALKEREAEEKGMEKGVESLITTLKELECEEDFIVSKLGEKFSITSEKAIMYYNKYK